MSRGESGSEPLINLTVTFFPPQILFEYALGLKQISFVAVQSKQ